MTKQQTDQSGVPTENPSQHWMREDVVAQFVAHSTAQDEQRREMFDVACDLFPFEPDAPFRVLDLGAGYGALSTVVLDRFPNATAVGLDLSAPMMAVGRERMARFGDRFSYHVGDLSKGGLPADLPGQFDAVITSAFVCHLPREAKQRLYAEIFRVLNPGGCFIDVDLIAPPNEEMRAWYREWRERGQRRHADQQEPRGPMHHHHFEGGGHLPETEADQLAFLRAVGFVQVDCFYKRLLMAVIAGYKPEAG